MSRANQNTAYVVNHSDAYTMAALASWVEFWTEYLIFGRLKLQYTCIVVGLSVIIAGQVSTCLTPVIDEMNP